MDIFLQYCIDVRRGLNFFSGLTLILCGIYTVWRTFCHSSELVDVKSYVRSMKITIIVAAVAAALVTFLPSDEVLQKLLGSTQPSL